MYCLSGWWCHPEGYAIQVLPWQDWPCLQRDASCCGCHCQQESRVKIHPHCFRRGNHHSTTFWEHKSWQNFTTTVCGKKKRRIYGGDLRPFHAGIGLRVSIQSLAGSDLGGRGVVLWGVFVCFLLCLITFSRLEFCASFDDTLLCEE